MGEIRKTAIIVPCFNEASRLDVQKFLQCTETYEWLHFLFVDDGSTDDTGRILDLLCRSHPKRLAWIRLEKNAGKAEAVRNGFLKALEGEFSYIGYWDADLATPLRTIPKFCEILENREIDLVIGSRVKLLGRNIQRRPLRHYLGRVFATGASLVLRLPVYDTQCGAKIFRNKKDLKIVFSIPFHVRWTFDVEVLARFMMIESLMGGASVERTTVEYPLEEWIDIAGSKVRPRDFLKGIIELYTIFRIYRSRGAKDRFLKDFSSAT